MAIGAIGRMVLLEYPISAHKSPVLFVMAGGESPTPRSG